MTAVAISRLSLREQSGEFLDYLDGKIARWWMPDDVIFVDQIPLGPTGKIDKKLLRTRLTGYALPFDSGLKR